jgi:excisionase family DNA binding protein
MTSNFLPIAVAARRLGVHPKTLHRLCSARKITFSLVGSRKKISEEAIAAYLADHRTFPAKKSTVESHTSSSQGAL